MNPPIKPRPCITNILLFLCVAGCLPWYRWQVASILKNFVQTVSQTRAVIIPVLDPNPAIPIPGFYRNYNSSIPNQRNRPFHLSRSIVRSHSLITFFLSVLWLIEIALSSVCVVWLCENYVARCEGLSTAHKNVILGERDGEEEDAGLYFQRVESSRLGSMQGKEWLCDQGWKGG